MTQLALDSDSLTREAVEPAHDHLFQREPGEIQQVALHTSLAQGATIASQAVKITTTPQKTDLSPVDPLSRGASLSTNTEHASDAASVHSMPAVHITDSPPQEPSDALPNPNDASPLPPPSPRSNLSDAAQQDRRVRHRSAVEVRASNRFSGFFNNLIHRRDAPSNNSTRSPLREDTSTEQVAVADTNSRPATPPRPVTPPPPLPAPTLRELGLSLSVLTSDLSPSHFSTPPSSGAFLAPHYLLLCHAQGLDVLPLSSPPTLQPYALVRRVPFKSVVVMEQRGVLVAIAGRRDGVRVYALEEVKKAVEWRMDVEIRREKERQRREAAKKGPSSSIDTSDRASRKSSLSTPADPRSGLLRKSSYASSMGSAPAVPPPPLIPRRATTQKVTPVQIPSPLPTEQPPPYSSIVEHNGPIELPEGVSDTSTRPARSRGASISNVLAPAPHTRRSESRRDGSKVDWAESSDEEPLDIVAAGPSGSQALDERTSAQLSATSPTHPLLAPSPQIPPASHRRTRSGSRRSRPSALDLSMVNSSIPPSEPSPAPTLLTLRQALAAPSSPPESPPVLGNSPNEAEDEEEGSGNRISLAQALMESRIPDLPPLGSRRPQQPILITSSHPIVTGEDEPGSPRTSDSYSQVPRPTESERPQRRRRWSVMLGQTSTSSAGPSEPSREAPSTLPVPDRPPTGRFRRSHSFRSDMQPPSLPSEPSTQDQASSPDLTATAGTAPPHSRTSRFIPRIFTNPFQNRRSDDRAGPVNYRSDHEGFRRAASVPAPSQAPPPKLEYVKLPGTKGALIVKAVETAKKSFLAILCGENGEKVELFAGTYRTALGLSRTFILPDSPRSLELQLQGDDLVEVFLVFSQNVFGLEPATVRVREVRIGRAERRAARRRARELRVGEGANDSEPPGPEEETVNVNIGVSVPVDSTIVATSEPAARDSSDHPAESSEVSRDDAATTNPPTEELVTVATAQMGPYTTFQQLGFSPRFPLASIADEYVIPPTYPDFLGYRAEYEQEASGQEGGDLTQVQFSPPGLPVPQATPPSRWFYRDPKNVIHGPWKATLMQAWYKDGLLPPDLPVRREEDTDYILLKDLRLQSVDPTHPFRPPPPPPPSVERSKPLLPPISLLAQPHHFGPPALFFSSRGGHSTAIVDARGRSVLKGRFVWSTDDTDPDSKSPIAFRMGDIKHLEAFDVKDRSVLVALRQGGLEAVDLGDALLKPADESRMALPQFTSIPSSIGRRGPFVWRMGTPLTSSPSPSSTSLPLPKGRTGSSLAPAKKQSYGGGRSPAGRSEFSSADFDSDPRDEMLFLGRKGDDTYFCERNSGSFRILRLCPQAS